MATFSVSDALSAGFDVIRRRPLSVVVWGLAYFVLGVLPSAGLMAVAGEDFLALFQQAATDPSPGHNYELIQSLNTKLTAYQPIVFLTAVLAKGVLAAAVFRAVLEPENRGFFYLRLGKDELWQALIYLCLIVVVILAAIAATFVGAAVGVAAWFGGQAVGSPWAGWIQALGMLVAIIGAGGAVVWLCLRLSLAGPMTFADRNFKLFESWTVTKGQAWRLFGLSLLLIVVMFVIELVIGAISWGALLTFVFSGGVDPERITAFFEQPVKVWLAALAPVAVGLAVLGALVTGAVYAIFTAPWAVAYRQLRSAPAEL